MFFRYVFIYFRSKLAVTVAVVVQDSGDHGRQGLDEVRPIGFIPGMLVTSDVIFVCGGHALRKTNLRTWIEFHFTAMHSFSLPRTANNSIYRL